MAKATKKVVKPAKNKGSKSVKRKPAHRKVMKKTTSSNRLETVSPSNQIHALISSLQAGFEKQATPLRKQIVKTQSVTDKLLVQKDKAQEKLAMFEQKVGDFPNAKDKKQLKALKQAFDKFGASLNKSQQALATQQKALQEFERETQYLTALNKKIKQLSLDYWQKIEASLAEDNLNSDGFQQADDDE